MKTLTATILLAITSLASAIQKQEQPNWCWAACIQTCLQQGGHYFSQSQIVANWTGIIVDRPAYPEEVAGTLMSQRFPAWIVERPGSPEELYNTLLTGWKIVAFVRPSDGPVGHFIVLEGVTYDGKILVSDPAVPSTVPTAPSTLYYRWRWTKSVVVGAPR